MAFYSYFLVLVQYDLLLYCMSFLHHIIYQSSVVAPLLAPELGRLLEQARFHNRLADITGVLLYDGSRFLQVLEGPPVAVAAVFARIRVDCRHTAVEVLADGPITHRQFASWSMGLVEDVRQPAGAAGAAGAAMPCLHTVTDAALWLLIREFQASAGHSLHPGGGGRPVLLPGRAGGLRPAS